MSSKFTEWNQSCLLYFWIIHRIFSYISSQIIINSRILLGQCIPPDISNYVVHRKHMDLKAVLMDSCLFWQFFISEWVRKKRNYWINFLAGANDTAPSTSNKKATDEPHQSRPEFPVHFILLQSGYIWTNRPHC